MHEKSSYLLKLLQWLLDGFYSNLSSCSKKSYTVHTLITCFKCYFLYLYYFHSMFCFNLRTQFMFCQCCLRISSFYWFTFYFVLLQVYVILVPIVQLKRMVPSIFFIKGSEYFKYSTFIILFFVNKKKVVSYKFN